MERRPNSPREENSRYIKDIPAFQNKFRDSFNEVIDNPENEDVLKKFRYAYEYRRALGPWMNETDGLEGAFQFALGVYVMEFTNERNDPKHMQAYKRTVIDDDFKEEMKSTVAKVSQNVTRLDLFAASLLPRTLFFVPIGLSEQEAREYIEQKRARRYPSVEEMTPQQISKELTNALKGYWVNIDQGTSSDPW